MRPTEKQVDHVGVGSHLRRNPDHKPCERGGKVSPRPRTLNFVHVLRLLAEEVVPEVVGS